MPRPARFSAIAMVPASGVMVYAAAQQSGSTPESPGTVTVASAASTTQPARYSVTAQVAAQRGTSRTWTAAFPDPDDTTDAALPLPYESTDLAFRYHSSATSLPTVQSRIHAVVLGGTVRDNAVVGGLGIHRGNTVVKDSARVLTAFQNIDAFEQNIVLSGAAYNIGDVEPRGASFSTGPMTTSSIRPSVAARTGRRRSPKSRRHRTIAGTDRSRSPGPTSGASSRCLFIPGRRPPTLWRAA